ncbi:MAG: mucoidy inhibitor MuiA family protein [Candidatus Saccharicenans sp.]
MTKTNLLFKLPLLFMWIFSLNLAVLTIICPAGAQEIPEKKVETLARENIKSEEIMVTSNLQSVVVYPERAQVWRKAEVNVASETRVLVFSGLPGTIIPESVRVSASGSARTKILGVEVKTEYLEAEQLPEVKKLLEEIKAVEEEISKIKAQEAILDAQEKFLNSFSSTLSGQVIQNLVSGRPDLAGVDKFIDYLGSRLQTIQKSRLENSNHLKEKQTKLEALRKKLNEIRPARSKEEKEVRVLIEVSQPGKLELDLSYSVSPAGWVPVYTIKAWPESSEVEITVAAKVIQKTGENWDKVKLILSTSQPVAGHQPGQLNPWYLGVVQPKIRRALSREQVEAKAVQEPEALSATAYEQMAEVVETWAGVNFEVKNNWTIPSDGAERRIPIDSQRLAAAFDYLSIPKLQELAFLRSSFKNTLNFPLLPGQADLFISQDFLGSATLDFVAANDEVKLFFGEDKQIKVKRELVKREKSGPGFLGKNEKVNLVYKIKLENLRNRQVEVELQDQIPVSQDSRIEVKDIRIIPQPTTQDDKGILTWKVRLDSGKKQELVIEFTVEYPKDIKIIGI